ncbi:MAG: DUF2066 domain-containing protein [Alphaproteobacteria bacterium]|nr:DUF2066 domain-containing protein [Alphaproteobacteria bacterium]
MKFPAFSLLAGLWFVAPAFAAGPIETNPYAVQGVEVDVTDVSAKAAKDKALVDAQMKAISQLGENLGSPDVAAELAKLDVKQVMPLLKSLSIEKEVIGPGHYQGTFTVRFLPDKVKPLLSSLGVKLPEEQGPPMLIIPVWTDEKGQMQLWEDNPWRKAWESLHASQAAIPIIIPLGDQDDATTLSPQDVTANNAVKIEAIRRRYDVKTLLFAFGQPGPEGGVHARVVGNSPLGKITIDKVYTADTHTLADSTVAAAQRFQQLITDKFRSDQAKAAGKAANAGPQALAISIPFAGPSEWNGLRSRILATPGVVGLDVTSLDAGGAAAKLLYIGSTDDLGNSLQASGLKLAHAGAAWSVVPF